MEKKISRKHCKAIVPFALKAHEDKHGKIKGVGQMRVFLSSLPASVIREPREAGA